MTTDDLRDKLGLPRIEGPDEPIQDVRAEADRLDQELRDGTVAARLDSDAFLQSVEDGMMGVLHEADLSVRRMLDRSLLVGRPMTPADLEPRPTVVNLGGVPIGTAQPAGSTPVVVDGILVGTSHAYTVTLDPAMDPKAAEAIREAWAASTRGTPIGQALDSTPLPGVMESMDDPLRACRATAQRARLLMDYVEEEQDPDRAFLLERARTAAESASFWLDALEKAREMDARSGCP